MKNYEAPWSKSLIVTSLLVTVLCLGISLGAWWGSVVKHQPAPVRWLTLVPLAIVCGSALFTIRGYTIEPDAILVHRLLWSTSLPRAGLESARVEPDAMRGSIRTFGNGGAFSFCGFFYSKHLGSYRAFVTDLRRTVVLRYATRNIVLSPARPDDFVGELGRP